MKPVLPEFTITLRDQEKDGFGEEFRARYGYRQLGILDFWPVTDSTIDLGILILNQKIDTGEVIGEMVISYKSAAGGMNQEQVNQFYPKLIPVLQEKGIPLPTTLCGHFNWERGIIDGQLAIPSEQ